MKFKEEDIKKINETIQNVEKECQAEIIPVIVKKSDDYPGARWRFVFTFSFVLSFCLVFISQNLSPIGLLLFQFVFLYIGYLLSFIPTFHRFFLLNYKVNEEVHQRALSAFLDYGVHKTKNRIGILIMISLLERKAKILCDIGINEKVPKDSWKPILDEMLKNIHQGHLLRGIEEALISCGKLVKKYSPREGEKMNELENKFFVLDS